MPPSDIEPSRKTCPASRPRDPWTQSRGGSSGRKGRSKIGIGTKHLSASSCERPPLLAASPRDWHKTCACSNCSACCAQLQRPPVSAPSLVEPAARQAMQLGPTG
eukprot:8314109-Pyramimonas_sp.AAC.1